MTGIVDAGNDSKVPLVENESRRRTRRFVRWMLVAIAAFVSLIACISWPPFYWQDAIRVQVVDAQTGEPIRGAAVVGIWVAAHGGWEETYSLYRHEETLTNEYGVFEFKKWGPRWRRSADGYLRDKDPIIYIYHPDYDAVRLDNRVAYIAAKTIVGRDGGRIRVPDSSPGPDQIVERSPGERSPNPKRFCFWSGKTIEIARATNEVMKGEALLMGNDTYLDDRDMFPTYWRLWSIGRDRVNADTLPEIVRLQLAPRGRR